MRCVDLSLLQWALAVLLSGVIGAQSDADSVPEREALASHRKMLDALDGIEIATLISNPYLGTADYERRKKHYEDLPAEAGVKERFSALISLGGGHLEQGFEVEAIECLERGVQYGLSDEGVDQIASSDRSAAIFILVTAYLRLGEVDNCCALANPESCIFPLSPKAWHSKRVGSESAAELLLHLLENFQLKQYDAGQAIWLLNLAHMTLGQYPDGVPVKWRLNLPEEGGIGFSSGPLASADKFPAFRNVAEERGVDTFSHAGGSIADDFDGDGLVDLVISSWDSAVSMSFFKNTGEGGFEKVDAGLDQIRGGLNLKQADFDNDGDLDILVLRGAWLGPHGEHPNSLLQNDGSGHFLDVSYAVGLAEPGRPTQTAEWLDFDLDGDLDLFVGNESLGERLAPCQLFRNDRGRFTDIAEVAGVSFSGFVKGVTSGDYDGDGYPDLFLSQIDGNNALFRNRGDGTFERTSDLLGKSAGPVRSFPTWFFDYNNDGWLDLFVSSYSSAGLEYVKYYTGNALPEGAVAALFRNDKGKGFTDVTREVNLDKPMLPMGSNYGDLTNNGFPDMYLGTGAPDYEAVVPNMLFVNDGGKFFDFTMTSRMGHLQKGHAVSFADFDSDGDLDVFEQMGGALRGDQFYDVLFENPGFGKHWLSVSLRGKQTNYYGVGARVGVQLQDLDEEPRWVFQWMNSGGSFGANPLRLHFGLGEASKILEVEVVWPVSGQTQVIKNVEMDQLINITEP